MKFNCKELAKIYFGPADLEGRLYHKRSHKSGFKERWFKLRYNFLFYHNTNEFGQTEGIQPSGVIILENCNIKIDVARESCFAFSIAFQDEPQKCHILSGRSESQIDQWVDAIKQASYGYWRSQLIILQQILCDKTGKDPLLMYPRNKGVIRDESWKLKQNFKSHIKSFALSATSTTSTDSNEINLINFV